MRENLYCDRDICGLDEIGGFYSRHVSAMTSESLNGKSKIAAELAYRDSIIEALKAECDAQQKRADALAVRNEQLMSFVTEVFHIAAQHCTLNRNEIHALGERLELFGHETYQPVLHGYCVGLETGESKVYVIKTQPADATLAAIESRGVEKFAEATIAIGEQEKEESIIYAGKQAMLFAKQLREAK
jgi:hypothetical protein